MSSSLIDLSLYLSAWLSWVFIRDIVTSDAHLIGTYDWFCGFIIFNNIFPLIIFVVFIFAALPLIPLGGCGYPTSDFSVFACAST